jgi:DNA-binding transcriptional ArsR family regulator
MSTLLEKEIKVNRILTTSVKHARAIEDPTRAKIIEILYHRALSADQISNELKKTGYKKALTTVRHHLEILKESGLIEIAKIEESRGAITKFYSTSTKLLGYVTPADFESKYSKVIDNTSVKIEKILRSLTPKTIKAKKTKGENSKDYSQYLVMEIMNRAMTNIMENSDKKHASFKSD